MNPLGTEETGLVILFGACAIFVLYVSIRLRARRYAIAASTIAGLLCGLVLWLLIAALSLLLRGTQGYQFGTWLVFVAGGLLPAGLVGLLEGLVASVIIRLLP